MSVTGVQRVKLPGTTRTKLQVFVAGSNANYVVTVKVVDNDGVEHERAPLNNTINGASGLPLQIEGKFSEVIITPPDVDPFTYSL